MCPVCQTPLTRSLKYCSNKCVGIAQRRPTRPCATCGTSTTNKKFCSKSCSAQTTNSTHPRRTRVQYHCGYCGKEIRSKWYCNETCHQTHRYEQYIKRWLAGEESGAQFSGEASATVRRWVRERAGYKCEQCGWAEINPASGTSPIQMDHIDGDFTNNRPENLRMLCPNCHSLTPTWCNLNKGHGRFTHKQRMRDD